MIQLYTWATPSGQKISIALEELGLAYTVHPIDLGKDEQFGPEFLAISPNNKIPAIVDDDGPFGRHILFESGAILFYLAQKTGRLLPPEGQERDQVIGWLFWASASLAPMLGRFNYYALHANPPDPIALDRFTAEAVRLLGVLDAQLRASPYLGEDFSIADISAFTWIRAVSRSLSRAAPEPWAAATAVQRWLSDLSMRPAFQRGLRVPRILVRVTGGADVSRA